MVTGLDHALGGLCTPSTTSYPPALARRDGVAPLSLPPQRGTLRGRRRAEGLEPRQPEDSAVGPPPLSIPSKGEYARSVGRIVVTARADGIHS